MIDPRQLPLPQAEISETRVPRGAVKLPGKAARLSVLEQVTTLLISHLLDGEMPDADRAAALAAQAMLKGSANGGRP